MDIYFIILCILALLAISDIIVGVSNDAVNFLNTAVGAKVAKLRWILIVAGLGVIFGAITSSGMMEVARKGIFHPQFFTFHQIILIFLAVMVTDVLLLDAFNTLGLPTSTTVSIVFELLGAAFGMAVMIVFVDGVGERSVMEYINSSRALVIILGILLSVLIAFFSGAVLQFISRSLFTFRYERAPIVLTLVWSAIVATAITYFVVVKGAKYATFIPPSTREAFLKHPWLISMYAFVFWAVVLMVLKLLKINIFRVLILFGTFALAMAFAGNDLVNFIGVPLAGYSAYEIYAQSGADPNQLYMEGLAKKVPTPSILLFLAGVIMMITLFVSSKARHVTKTEVSLGRQGWGEERFGASALSRAIVRGAINVGQFFKYVTPIPVQSYLRRRFDDRPFKEKMKKLGKEAPMFDYIRACVTLMVASVLISMATIMKLPLSTTYVTFMTAMGTSFADGAWGRESAVYRVSGVFTVVGGWFVTAFLAFTVSFIIVSVFYWTGWPAVFAMLALAAYIIYRTHKYHTLQLERERETRVEDYHIQTKSDLIRASMGQIEYVATQMDAIIPDAIEGLYKEDVRQLTHAVRVFDDLNVKTKRWKDSLDETIDNLPEEVLDIAHYYVQVMDYIREITHSIYHIVYPAYNHIRNNHKPLKEDQMHQLLELHQKTREFYIHFIQILQQGDFKKYEKLLKQQKKLIKLNNEIRKSQIKRIKKGIVGTRNSLLFFNLLAEFKNLALYGLNLYKSQRDMILSSQGNLVETSEETEEELA